jgi:hypothetical protein
VLVVALGRWQQVSPLVVGRKLRVQGLIALLFQLLLAEAWQVHPLALGIMGAEAPVWLPDPQAKHHNLAVAVVAQAVPKLRVTYSMRHLLVVNPTTA